MGIQSDTIIHDDKQKELLDEESKILFKTLLDLGQPLGKICTELEEAARRYGKIKKIPPPQLREWAGDMPNRNPDKRIRKWCYAIAIDVLQQHGINPITIAAPEKVAEYWAIQRQETHSLKQAIEQFIKNFHVSDDKKSIVIDSITQVYKKLASV